MIESFLPVCKMAFYHFRCSRCLFFSFSDAIIVNEEEGRAVGLFTLSSPIRGYDIFQSVDGSMDIVRRFWSQV